MTRAGNNTTKDRLGPVILSCRPRPLREAMGDLGMLGGYYFWVGPLLCAILAMFLTFPIVGIAAANKVPAPLLVQPLWGHLIIGWWFVCFVVTLWYAYILPRGDSLVLYENGFRCRISQRRWEVPFRKLREIRLGEKTKQSQSLLSEILSLRYRYVLEFAKKAKATSLTLIFANSKRSRIPTLLVRFEAEDLKEFFRYLMDHHADLFVEDG
jgi:hypothetical protein